MKQLKKIELATYDVAEMNRQELMAENGGNCVYYGFRITKDKDGNLNAYPFSTESAELMALWADIWSRLGSYVSVSSSGCDSGAHLIYC